MGIWDQLNTRTLFGSAKVTPSQMNAQEKDIHLEEKNRALLADVNLINKAVMRDGSPIPNTCAIKTVTLSDDSRTSLFEPEAGSVYTVQSITVNWTSKTGDAAIIVYAYDEAAGNITQLIWQNNTSTGSVTINLTADSEYSWPIVVDENCYLQVLAGTDANWATCEFEALVYRVR